MTAITIVGNLAQDPELRFTNNGKAVASFTVMSSKSIKKPDGTWEASDMTAWTVKCWNRLAENVADSLRKGVGVVVQGSATQAFWEDKTSGEKKSRIEVTAFSVGVDLKRHIVTINEVTNRTETTKSDNDPWAMPITPTTSDDPPPF